MTRPADNPAGPTASQLRARVITMLEREIARGTICASCHHPRPAEPIPCEHCGAFHGARAGHVVQEWER